MKFLIGLLVDFDQSPAARWCARRWNAELPPPMAAARFSDHLPGHGTFPPAAGTDSPAPAPPERGRIVDLVI